MCIPRHLRSVESLRLLVLKLLLDVPDFPANGGNMPIRACGLIVLNESPSIKPSDKQKLILYLCKLKNC